MTPENSNFFARESEAEQQCEPDSFHVDTACRTVERRGVRVTLTAKELRLLQYLIEQRGRVLSREELHHEVWSNRQQSSRTLDMHVSAIRRKLGLHACSNPRLLTLRGRGYVFV
jgi:DNA-binding response OmpR family regulator